MRLLESIIYGIFCGLTEFLPVSSQGHRVLLKELMGITTPEPLRELLIHFGVLFSLLISCGTYIEKLRRENSALSHGRRRTGRDRRTEFDLRLIKTAAVPAITGSVLSGIWGRNVNNLAMIALFLCINGIILFLPEHAPQGNKDSSKLSAFQSILIGLSGAASIFPGISRVGAALSCAVGIKADRNKALEWVYILSIPALFAMIVFDCIGFFTHSTGVSAFSDVLGCIVSSGMAFVGGIIGIYLMRFLCSRSAVALFSYYCWGAGLLSFIIFLAA